MDPMGDTCDLHIISYNGTVDKLMKAQIYRVNIAATCWSNHPNLNLGDKKHYCVTKSTIIPQ